MTDLFGTLSHYLSYPFVQRALIVGCLVALCASLLGVVLVLKRFSYIGDGLSQVAFGAIAIATALKIANQMLLMLPLTILMATLLLSGGQRARVRGDAALAMLSVSALAIGYVLLNAFPASTNVTGDVCSTLFGSTAILTLTDTEVWMSLGLSILVLITFSLLYHRIFSVTFDEDFASATGTPARRYNLILAAVIATVVVLSMQLVGSLLITALLVIPPLGAMQLCRSFKAVTITSALSAVLCAGLGMLISILFSTPVGASIVLMNLCCFILLFITGRILPRRSA